MTPLHPKLQRAVANWGNSCGAGELSGVAGFSWPSVCSRERKAKFGPTLHLPPLALARER